MDCKSGNPFLVNCYRNMIFKHLLYIICKKGPKLDIYKTPHNICNIGSHITKPLQIKKTFLLEKLPQGKYL